MPAMNFHAINIPELWRRARYLFSRFDADRCSENAAALTYMSLFALVPLLTVVYTMASAVPAFQGLEDKMQAFMFEHLMPETNSEIRSYLDDFSRQAKNLTGPGHRLPGGHRGADAAQYRKGLQPDLAGQRKPQPGVQFPAVLGSAEPGTDHDRPGPGAQHLPVLVRRCAGETTMLSA